MISVTASARSPITPTVSSRPGMYSSTSAALPKRQARATAARRLSPRLMISTPTEEPSFDRLHHVGQRQRIGGFEFVGRHDAPARDRQPGGGEHRLRRDLVHRERGGAHAGMRVGNRQPVEHALDRAVLAEAAVQRVEHRVGARCERGDHGGEVFADLDRRDVEAGLAQRERSPAGRWQQADLAFSREKCSLPRPAGSWRQRVTSPASGLPRAAHRCDGSPIPA